MEPSAAPDLHHVWVTEKDDMVAKYESDLALQEELFDKLVQELRSVNESNLRELKAVVPSKLYRDIISPMAEKSFNYDKREIEASHKKRIGLIEDKHTKALAQHEVLYREKLKAALVNKNQPAPKPGSLPILSESTDDRSDHVSVSENSKKRKASTPEETHPKRLRVDTSVNQVRTPAPTPANEPAHSPRRTITFDEVYQDGRAKHKDIIVEWPTGSRQWYILKCEQHGLRFTRNSVQGAAKHLNGNGHGRTDRNRDYAVKTLGYLVTGCDENLAKLNNQVAEEAYANGYKPPLPRLKKQRDPLTGSKKKQLGGRGLASRPSVPHAANQVPGPAQEMSSSAQKVAAKERRESGTPSARQKSSDSGDGITHPKDFHIYYGRWKDDGLGKERDRIYPVMVLGWDSQNGSGLKDSDLNATGLLKKKAKPPNCYTYDSRKITGWAPGYEDGGPKVRFRKFPVMFFDESQTVGWFPARDLMKFPLDKRKAPAQPDHPFNAARRWIAEREGFETWEDREMARTGGKSFNLMLVKKFTRLVSSQFLAHTF
ncbi:uncharacterized protein F4807DRAFT_337277 [Annulohypoxylon truncatum]|uniref:uncharacterized protein n=1 Tax=Annulohypoxylon truncatum TaxID=327061 RepID=UPI0020082A48|nr:uncharacterized protein F4807DRAFT_337277 [Annulohypoxylon truncatum]KAI1204323.1 hypothetical protein F4807DRAFT_337277 [Annulohypoxylon truncatum]